MKAEEIIELGGKLGLPFDRKSNFEDQLKRDIVVFDGANAQRFLIDGSWSDDDILANFGKALKAMGNMQHRLELRRLLEPF